MNGFKLHFLLIIFLAFGIKTYGQTESTPTDSIPISVFKIKRLSLITGYQNNNGHFAEIGIGIKEDNLIGDKKSSVTYAFSNELKLNDVFVWGLKAGIWIEGGIPALNMGFNLINYTDFEENLLCFRPEIGVGFGFFRVVYGFHFALTDSDFNKVNVHNLGINILLNFKKLKEEKHIIYTTDN